MKVRMAYYTVTAADGTDRSGWYRSAEQAHAACGGYGPMSPAVQVGSAELVELASTS